MTRIRLVTFAALTLVVALFARPAFAGPPLLCVPFDIGAAKSLPMGAGSWKATDPKYNVAHLVDDTLALLTPDTPVLVRMETLRRATIYAAANPAAATALLAALQARAAVPDSHAGLAVFDFAYVVETYREAKPIFRSLDAAIDHIDGYQLVLKAQAMQRDAAMTRAAQLIADGQPKSTAIK
jgi:hypothetical protein